MQELPVHGITVAMYVKIKNFHLEPRSFTYKAFV